MEGSRFEIVVDGRERPFTFNITQDKFGAYVRESARDPLMAANNLLVGTVEKGEGQKDRDDLVALFKDHMALPIQIMQPIEGALMGEHSVKVKKL